LQNELLAEGICGVVTILDGDEGVDGLASQLVSNTNDSRFSNGVVLNQSSLNLGGRETVTADVDDIVDTASDPVESLMVTGSTITSELSFTLLAFFSSSSLSHIRVLKGTRRYSYVVALVYVKVGVQVSLVAAVDGTSDAGP
jgi:hypothetical protein